MLLSFFYSFSLCVIHDLCVLLFLFLAFLPTPKKEKYTLRGSRVYSIFVRWSLTNPIFYPCLCVFLSPWEMHCHRQKREEYEFMCLQVKLSVKDLGDFDDTDIQCQEILGEVPSDLWSNNLWWWCLSKKLYLSFTLVNRLTIL